jgi:N-acetyl-gamma-glutamyl-phosphate reductase
VLGYAGPSWASVNDPGCELAALTSLEYPGRSFSQVIPALAGIVDLPFSQDPSSEKIAAAAEVVFTAVPHQTAMGMIPRYLELGCKVVDLSADFASGTSVYMKYQAHTAELLDETVYGLPELHQRVC